MCVYDISYTHISQADYELSLATIFALQCANIGWVVIVVVITIVDGIAFYNNNKLRNVQFVYIPTL